jgi:chaperone required for assembly of F1-ATPase
MKRFYKEVTIARETGGYAILLDDRPVRTPARKPLLLPTEPLADAVAEEWRAQEESVDPRAMPLTGLSNAALDRVAEDPAAFASGLARYGESDLLCYRAEGPESLVQRQDALWNPLLDWARRRFDVDFVLVCGIMHQSQPSHTLERLSAAVASRSPFRLAGLSPLVTISGSLLIALALAEGAIEVDAAWAAASLDEAWQAEQWGEDAEAKAALDARQRDFAAAHRFLILL